MLFPRTNSRTKMFIFKMLINGVESGINLITQMQPRGDL